MRVVAGTTPPHESAAINNTSIQHQQFSYCQGEAYIGRSVAAYHTDLHILHQLLKTKRAQLRRTPLYRYLDLVVSALERNRVEHTCVALERCREESEKLLNVFEKRKLFKLKKVAHVDTQQLTDVVCDARRPQDTLEAKEYARDVPQESDTLVTHARWLFSLYCKDPSTTTASSSACDVISRVDRAADALAMEMARGRFLPCCSVAYACLARIRVVILRWGRAAVAELRRMLTNLMVFLMQLDDNVSAQRKQLSLSLLKSYGGLDQLRQFMIVCCGGLEKCVHEVTVETLLKKANRVFHTVRNSYLEQPPPLPHNSRKRKRRRNSPSSILADEDVQPSPPVVDTQTPPTNKAVVESPGVGVLPSGARPRLLSVSSWSSSSCVGGPSSKQATNNKGGVIEDIFAPSPASPVDVVELNEKMDDKEKKDEHKPRVKRKQKKKKKTTDASVSGSNLSESKHGGAMTKLGICDALFHDDNGKSAATKSVHDRKMARDEEEESPWYDQDKLGKKGKKKRKKTNKKDDDSKKRKKKKKQSSKKKQGNVVDDIFRGLF